MSDILELSEKQKAWIIEKVKLTFPSANTIFTSDTFKFKDSGNRYFAGFYCDKADVNLHDFKTKLKLMYPFFQVDGYLDLTEFGSTETIEVCIRYADKYEWYMDYIKSTDWYNFRASIFSKRGFKCETCSSKQNLQLHHLTYERLGNENEQDVMILCKRCHENAHRN